MNLISTKISPTGMRTYIWFHKNIDKFALQTVYNGPIVFIVYDGGHYIVR